MMKVCKIALTLACIGLARWLPAAVLQELYSFPRGLAVPMGRLMQGPDGAFYGTTEMGGSSDAGAIFRITTKGAISTLASLTWPGPIWPRAGPVLGLDGAFYGTSSHGGARGVGTVFRVTTNGAVRVLFSFTGGDDGAHALQRRAAAISVAIGAPRGRHR
jgi:uncharacterized repeat protein (TIGR03803 family)